MSDYLAKPFTRAQLAAALERHLAPLTAGQSAATDEARPGVLVERSATKVFDPSVVQSLPMVADGTQPEFAGLLFDTFTESTIRLLAELDEAARKGDAQSVQRAAHTLKSSGATVGALALSEQARQLETLLRAGNEPATDWPLVLRRSFDEFAEALARHRAAAAEKKSGAA